MNEKEEEAWMAEIDLATNREAIRRIVAELDKLRAPMHVRAHAAERYLNIIQHTDWTK